MAGLADVYQFRETMARLNFVFYSEKVTLKRLGSELNPNLAYFRLIFFSFLNELTSIFGFSFECIESNASDIL